MELFGVGAMEAGLILVVTLLVVGPHRFPEIAREGGRWYRTARRYANEVMRDVRGAMSELESEVKAQTEDLQPIREIGRDLSSSAEATRRDIDSIGSQTRDSASGAASSSIGGPSTSGELKSVREIGRDLNGAGAQTSEAPAERDP